MRMSKSLPLILAISAALAVSGCSLLKGSGKSKELKNAEKARLRDDAPETKSTGSLPSDSQNARYTNEDLRGNP